MLALAWCSLLVAPPALFPGLRTLDGARVPIPKDKVTVLIAVSADCPIANRYAPEIRRIVADYSPRGVEFYRVYVQLGKKNLGEVRDHGKAYRLGFPALLDPKFEFLRTYGFRVTPEVAVISKSGGLAYRGRIDDFNAEHGRVREDYRRDLRLTLEELLGERPVAVPRTAAVGCYIPFPD